MYMPVLSSSWTSHPLTWPRLLLSLTLWLCVCISLRFGLYADYRMELGPSSSRMVKASSVFVEHVQLRDQDRGKGAALYGFSSKPELNGQTNWNLSQPLIIESYNRKGFSLWLNKGSRIQLRLETQTTRIFLDQLKFIVIKGEHKHEILEPKQRISDQLDTFALTQTINGYILEVAYKIKENDKYYVGVINNNPRSIIMRISVNVTSKTYDISKASRMCSTSTGSCRLNLVFPRTHYLIVTTPSNGNLGGTFVELSFLARVLAYVAILGFLIVIIIAMLKYFSDDENNVNIRNTIMREIPEIYPIMQEKTDDFTYGTREEEGAAENSLLRISSEDLYDAKLCVICYNEQRNIFFVPCGHSATCYNCTERIIESESKICPICRRPIYKVRRLSSP